MTPGNSNESAGGNTAKQKDWRSRVWPVAKVLITIGILAEIGNRVDLRALLTNLEGASAPSLAISLSVLLFSPLLGGARWWMVLKAIGKPASLRSITATFWIGMAFAQILPNIAGEAIKIWIATRQDIPVKIAIHSVLFERLAMVLALLVMVMLTEPLLAARVPTIAVYWMAPLLLFGGIVGVGMLANADRASRYLKDVQIFRHLAELSVHTRMLCSSRWLLPISVSCALSHLTLIIAAWQLGKSLGLSLPFLDYLAFIPLVTIAMILPISVNGWGMREGLVIALFGSVGIATAPALAFSILFGILMAAISLPGLFAWWLNSDRRTPQEKRSIHIKPTAISRHAGKPK